MDVGVREWVASLDRPGIPAAAFDTIVAKPFLLGSAAGKLAKALRRAGCRLVVPAESFVVTDTAGPLRDGELDRARRWGTEVAKLVAVSQRA